MFLKSIFYRRHKEEAKEEIREKNKDVLQEIMLIITQIKNEYSLEDYVNVQFSDEYPINKGITKFENNICYIEIGVEGCRGKKKLLEDEWITLQNTIVHELTHAKNYVKMTQDTRDKLKDNLHSLTYFARQLVDEYSAYKAADDRYKQVVINSSENSLQRALKPFWFNKQFIQDTGLNAERRYDYFYDDCTAIIIHSIRNKKFPSIPETYSGYNATCKKIMEIVQEYNSKMPLDYDQYEEAGKKLWNALLLMVPVSFISNFKMNVGIKF
ncbi:hypothetical protein IZY60_10605 [Lutibacter sp. B2]|nr:hypothetical protein [Lutibacter sp. B2]